MDKREHILTVLAEEITEVLECIMENKPDAEFELEVRDLYATIELVNEKCGLHGKIRFKISPVKKSYGLFAPIMDIYINTHKKMLVKPLLNMQYFIFKGLRFGFADVKPGTGRTNNQEIQRLANLVATVVSELLAKKSSLSRDRVLNRKLINEKKEKIERFMKYAKKQGTLS